MQHGDSLANNEAVERATYTYRSFSKRPRRQVMEIDGDTPAGYESTFRPCFSTTDSSLRAIPLGRFVPASQFWTVDLLVLR